MNPYMTDLDKDLILLVVRYYMNQDLRYRVMQMVPTAYSAWVNLPKDRKE